MVDLKLQEWQKYCFNAQLKFNNEEVSGIVSTLGRKEELFTNVLLAFLNEEEKFEYKPRVGAEINFNFNGDQVLISRLDEKIVLSNKEFINLMASIDAVYSKILPLGSVVELNNSLIDDDIKEEFPNLKHIYLLIVGQKVVNENQYLDYLCTYYPNGMDKTNLIPIQNHMIKRVVKEGPDTPIGNQYIKYLKNRIINDGLISTSFAVWREGVE